MVANTNKQGLCSPKLVFTVEIGVRRVGEFRAQGILSSGLECQEFPLGCWSFLGGVTFSWNTALSASTWFLFVLCCVVFYDSEMHVDSTVNVVVV